MKMKYPFLRDTFGTSLDQYAFMNGTIGMLAGLAAPALGGYFISKYGLARLIWPFTLAQNGLHLLFALAVIYAPEIRALDTSILGVEAQTLVITVIIVVEMIGAGLGTAVFMVYIMRCCRPEHKAAHMALLTALMSVSFTLAGVASGFLAEALGFTAYFVFTFLVTIPGMLLTLYVPHVAARDAPPRRGTAARAREGGGA
jgi:PAT family beta-lactamase induction signal transducer AmpG